MERHVHTLIVAPVGSGRLRLARALASAWGWLELASISDARHVHQVAHLEAQRLTLDAPPFRAPHHTCSDVALAGSLRAGWNWRPGECSLAHGGVLCLDEFPEFRSNVYAIVKEAMKHGHVSLGSRGACIDAPASFTVIALANPCPCGLRGSPSKLCRCTSAEVRKFRSRWERRLPFGQTVDGADAIKARIAELEGSR